MRKHFFRIMYWTVFMYAILSVYSYAGTWRDQFDDINLNGWERIVEEDPWFASWEIDPWNIGYLYTVIEKPKQEQVTAADFLHWNAHQFQLDKVTVVGEKIRYPQDARFISGELCLFLGKRQPSPDFAEGYIFSPEKTTRVQFSAKGVYKIGEVKTNYNDRFRLTSGHLKVVFDTGQFQLFTQEILIAEFTDAEFSMIDVAGLMVVPKPSARWFEGTISSFSISGKGIPNHNSLDVQLHQEHLTTIWGELKR